jgi:hypothetical protein
MLQTKGETVDRYKGYHYYINAVSTKSKHKLPYVAVDDMTSTRIARILIETQEIEYYPKTPDTVKRDEANFKKWIKRNYSECAKVWNELNPKYPVKTAKPL